MRRSLSTVRKSHAPTPDPRGGLAGSALRDLDRAHTPAAIQKAITESVERFTRTGRDPRTLTFGCVRETLPGFTTRRPPAHHMSGSPSPEATAAPSMRPTYPLGLPRLH